MKNENAAFALALNAQGNRVAYSDGTHIVLCEMPGGKVLHVLEYLVPVQSLCFHPDGTLLAAGHRGGEVQLWDSSSGKAVSAFFLDDRVDSLAFAPDGKTLYAADASGTVQPFDIAKRKPQGPPWRRQLGEDGAVGDGT